MRVGTKVWFVDDNRVYFGIINEEYLYNYNISSKFREHFVPSYNVFKTKVEAEAKLKENKQHWIIQLWNDFFGV